MALSTIVMIPFTPLHASSPKTKFILQYTNYSVGSGSGYRSPGFTMVRSLTL